MPIEVRAFFRTLARERLQLPGRALAICSVPIFLWGLVATLHFAFGIASMHDLPPCDRFTKPGLTANVFFDYRHQWGRPFYGFDTGAYHCYGGPGGPYLRLGAGDLVVEFSYPRCR